MKFELKAKKILIIASFIYTKSAPTNQGFNAFFASTTFKDNAREILNENLDY